MLPVYDEPDSHQWDSHSIVSHDSKDATLVTTPIAQRRRDECPKPRKAVKVFDASYLPPSEPQGSLLSSPSVPFSSNCSPESMNGHVMTIFKQWSGVEGRQLQYNEPDPTLISHANVSTPLPHSRSGSSSSSSSSSSGGSSRKRKRKTTSPMAKLATNLCDKPHNLHMFLQKIIIILSDELAETDKEWVMSLENKLLAKTNGNYNDGNFQRFKNYLSNNGRISFFNHLNNPIGEMGRVVFLAAFMIALEESNLVRKVVHSIEEVQTKTGHVMVDLEDDEKEALVNYFNYITALKCWLPIHSGATVIKQTAELLNFSQKRATFGSGANAYAKAVEAVFGSVFNK